jgi:hypothetical protein
MRSRGVMLRPMRSRPLLASAAAVLLVAVTLDPALANHPTGRRDAGAMLARKSCGSFRARHHRFSVYVLRGRASCAEARRVLRAWLLDKQHTQRYGRWSCFDSHGRALARGQVQHCSAGRRNLIADYG